MSVKFTIRSKFKILKICRFISSNKNLFLQMSGRKKVAAVFSITTDRRWKSLSDTCKCSCTCPFETPATFLFFPFLSFHVIRSVQHNINLITRTHKAERDYLQHWKLNSRVTLCLIDLFSPMSIRFNLKRTHFIYKLVNNQLIRLPNTKSVPFIFQQVANLTQTTFYKRCQGLLQSYISKLNFKLN